MSRIDFLEKYAKDGKHYNMDSELEEASKSPKLSIQNGIANRKDLKPNHIDNLIDSNNIRVMYTNPNITKEHLHRVLDKKPLNWTMVNEAIRHSESDISHIEKVVKGNFPTVLKNRAIQRNDVTPELIKHVFDKNEDADLVNYAIEHSNTTPDQLREFYHKTKLSDESRMNVILGHKNAPHDIMDHAINNHIEFPHLGSAVASNEAASQEHLMKLMDSPYDETRVHVMWNKSAGESVINKGKNDPISWVRTEAHSRHDYDQLEPE